jgi:murein DD-endopeptidase MepM/ murein hydrolase activator NlpD
VNATARGLPHVYRGRVRRTASDIYDADHRRSGRFRWLLSTCLAAAVGIIAIGVVIFGSLDAREAGIDIPSVMSRVWEAPLGEKAAGPVRRSDGPRWAVPRSDRMQAAAGAPTVRQLIHEQIQVRRNGRPYNQIRPYVRLVTRLQPVPPRNLDVIPTFNPIALYGSPGGGREGGAAATQSNDFRFQVIELTGIGGAVPVEDGIELSEQEVADLVAAFDAEEAQAQASAAAAAAQTASSSFSRPLSPPDAQLTTVLLRNRPDQSVTGRGPEKQVQRLHIVKRGERLQSILTGMGGDHIQVQQMIRAMARVLPEAQVVPGLQLQVTMVPSLSRAGDEPARFSLVAESGEHRVSVMRNAANEFDASATPFASQVARAAMAEGDNLQSASIYASLYNAALMLGVPSATIQQKLRVHAYDTDFRRQVAGGDYAEFFFDLREEPSGETSYGDLLYTAMATGGEIYRYWRFRTPDNTVDYFDENGNNSKKFLLRRPVRGENIRLSSGFGMRFHPILRQVRPHRGIDWAAPTGTPILAAGTGIVEEARYKGEYGNHIRIQHANGYHSTYSHLSRYAPRIQEGTRVRQGEVIGFVGNTGLSSGPHLHFEILVNQNAVDPLSIQVPRERQLTGKILTEFQKERARIDDLMRRPPVASEMR